MLIYIKMQNTYSTCIFVLICLGQTDISLSDFGESQAQLVGTRLQNERFTHVFSSDLARARQTASIIAEANKVTRCEVNHDKRLRERVCICNSLTNTRLKSSRFGIKRSLVNT